MELLLEVCILVDVPVTVSGTEVFKVLWAARQSNKRNFAPKTTQFDICSCTSGSVILTLLSLPI